MIPYLLAVAGGYLIGSSIEKTPKYKMGGGVDFVNDVKVYNDEANFLQDILNQKLIVYRKHLEFDKVTGRYDNVSSNLKFYKRVDSDNPIFTIVSKYNEKNDTMPAVLTMNNDKSEYNDYPFGAFGGLDDNKLSENFKNAIQNIGKYSAVISLEGYNIYTSDANSKEEADNILQGFKDNTRFEVVKGKALTGKITK